MAAVTAADEISITKTAENLASLFGPLLAQSKIFPFSLYTDYYAEEMGSSLVKQIFVYKTPNPVHMLPDFKIQTNRLEDEQRNDDNKRNINIDPGYLTLSRLILASTKDQPHRIHINHGIFGEITLAFKKNTYKSNPWTYGDYSAQISFFNKVRLQLKTIYDQHEDEMLF